jgi:hypothetical protein
MDEGLTETHRRVIGSGMVIIDAAAVRMLNLLEGRSSPAAMKVVEGSVTDAEREEIEASLKQIQAMISSFAQKYDLHPSRKNLRRILASDISQIWIALEDSRPTRIRGYGAMPVSSAESLEADLQEMLAVATSLRRLLHQ